MSYPAAAFSMSGVYRVPRFLLIYELDEPSSGDLSRAVVQADDDRAAQMEGPEARLRTASTNSLANL
jgi:hypothetical protein